MFAAALVVTGFGLANLVQAMRAPTEVLAEPSTAGVTTAAEAPSFWARTPAAARLAFAGLVYWVVVGLADTFLSANLPGMLRVTMAPILATGMVLAAFALRGKGLLPQFVGLALTAGAGTATIVYWVVKADLLTFSGSLPSSPGDAYYTLLPWPVLLIVGIALDLAILALGIRHVVQQPPSPARGWRLERPPKSVRAGDLAIANTA